MHITNKIIIILFLTHHDLHVYSILSSLSILFLFFI